MTCEEMEAACETEFAIIKAKVPALNNEDHLIFKAAFAAGAAWALQVLQEEAQCSK